jgi:hypothetical protein
MGLNYPYDRFGNILPFLIRPYGGTTDVNDWNLVINGGSTGVNINKTGGSGWCYVEFTDAWFAKSVIDNSYGNILSFVEGFISTLAPDLGETGEVFIALAPAGLNLTSSVVDLQSLTAAYIKYEKNKNTFFDTTNSYAVRYRGESSQWGYFIGDGANKFGLHLQASPNQLNSTNIRQKGGSGANLYDPDDVNWFPIWNSPVLPNGAFSTGNFGNNPKLSVYIGMNGNFAISDLRMRGLVGY